MHTCLSITFVDRDSYFILALCLSLSLSVFLSLGDFGRGSGSKWEGGRWWVRGVQFNF